MKYLSLYAYAWLEQAGHLDFARYFIGLAMDTQDRNWRKVSIEIAAQWCILHETGRDGKQLDPIIQNLIEPLVDRTTADEGYDPVNWFWLNMCQHCAAYAFAQIDEFKFTRALYGIYRTLLPEERDVEPFDQQILSKLVETFATQPDYKQITFGTHTNGLDSQIIAHPPAEAQSWTEYADQYKMIVFDKN